MRQFVRHHVEVAVQRHHKLHAIAVAHPSSLDELAAIRGVGPSKLAQYGAALLAAVEATDSR